MTMEIPTGVDPNTARATVQRLSLHAPALELFGTTASLFQVLSKCRQLSKNAGCRRETGEGDCYSYCLMVINGWLMDD